MEGAQNGTVGVEDTVEVGHDGNITDGSVLCRRLHGVLTTTGLNRDLIIGCFLSLNNNTYIYPLARFDYRGVYFCTFG